ARTAVNAGDANTVFAGVLQMDGSEIRHAVGSDVVLRIAEFIEQLLLYGVGGNAAASAGVLGDGERSVRLGLDDRIADVGHIRNILPVDLAIPAGALGSALDDMARDGAGGQLVPLVVLPFEAVYHGRQR